jgi:predicted nuclease of predicted toxin-antitoxin system
MYLLLDECCAKSLVAVAERLGHTAQRTIDAEPLGRQASDQAIFAFASSAEAVIVTVNRSDFIALASRGRVHRGVILIPSVPVEKLKVLFASVLSSAAVLFETERNLFVEIDAKGVITRFTLP